MTVSTSPEVRARRHPTPSPRQPATGEAARQERTPAATLPWARQPAPAESWLEPAAWNCKRVRRRTAQLVGEGGHRALVHRALAIAREEFRWLGAVSVGGDGRLSGLETVLPSRTPEERKAACLAIRKQYVKLLLRFLGEELTGKLVGDDWPELLPTAR